MKVFKTIDEQIVILRQLVKVEKSQETHEKL